jgi:ABC-type spermidine/putrescine transport system permease subunit II
LAPRRAILINSVSGKARTALYGMMISTILIPGVVIGISTMIMWTKLGGVLFGPEGKPWPFIPGLHLSVLGQVSYISAYVMLLVLARLQSFDPGLEEAALDLGRKPFAGDAAHPAAASLSGPRRGRRPSPSSSRSRTSTSPFHARRMLIR